MIDNSYGLYLTHVYRYNLCLIFPCNSFIFNKCYFRMIFYSFLLVEKDIKTVNSHKPDVYFKGICLFY